MATLSFGIGSRALNQIWVTSGVDVQQGRHMVEYHKVLSKHAFGNFRNLMKDMTLNPAMGGLSRHGLSAPAQTRMKTMLVR